MRVYLYVVVVNHICRALIVDVFGGDPHVYMLSWWLILADVSRLHMILIHLYVHVYLVVVIYMYYEYTVVAINVSHIFVANSNQAHGYAWASIFMSLLLYMNIEGPAEHTFLRGNLFILSKKIKFKSKILVDLFFR